MSFLAPQNPGIGGLNELTSSEEALVQALNALGDPGADRILFWDESANAYTFLTVGSGFTITDTTITASGGTLSGTINEIAYFDSASTIASLSVATYPSLTELTYVKGVTSAIQTQMNLKAPLISPAFTTPSLGVATATSINGLTITSSTGTLTIAAGRTLTSNKTLTLDGTNGTTMTFPSTSKTILANDLSNIGTATANLIFTDNTYDIGASGATRPRTIYVATSVVSPVVNATTGVQINGAAASNKILKGNGTNFVVSTETYAAPGTSGNVMTSDGTNWTSAAPVASGSTTAVDSTQSVYNNYEIEFSGSGASPTGDTWTSSAIDAATRWNGKLLRVTFGTNSTAAQFLPGNIGASSAILQFGNGKDIIISWNAKYSSASGQIGIGIVDNTDCLYAVSTDGGKIMFTYDGTTLNAVNGDTSETTTDVSSGITRTNWNAYKIVYNYGTNVLFYINNTLVATHTTNLPTTSNNARFGIGGATAANTAEIANVVISVEK